MKKKTMIIIILSIFLVLGIVYVIPAHVQPYLEYKKHIKRFEKYAVETITEDNDFFGSLRVERLEMTAEEYQTLKKELLEEGWKHLQGEECKPFRGSIGESEMTGQYEYFEKKEHAGVLFSLIDNKIIDGLNVVVSDSKVLIEYTISLDIIGRPGIKYR